jgi:hypothetical protein
MSSDYTTTFAVDQTPDEVFAAINNVRSWWTGDIDGDADHIGSEFTYRYADIHRSTQKVTQLVPGQKVAWHVVDGYLNFTDDKTEWTDTDVVFEIAKAGDKTQLTFTHLGLVPEVECFDRCSSGWSFYIDGSLRQFIATGKGKSFEAG